MAENNRLEMSHLRRVPSLAGMPHRLLDAPLWLPASAAASLAAYHWEDAGLHVEMANPTAPIARAPRWRQPTGVLRHRDLDVLLGLTHHWIAQGMRDDGRVEVSLHDTLRWIGYGESLASAPYAELHASIMRLRYCRVLIYRTEDRDLVADDRSRYDATLLADLSSDRQTRPGAERVMLVRLGESMMSWMADGSQAIDLDVYAHLVRHPATRRIPLARVVWVALARHRQADGSLRFRPGWLAARYGDRRDRTEDNKGRLIYRDAYNSRSGLARALTALARAGVLGLRTTSEGWCEGQFGHPPGLRRLRDEPRQKRLFTIDTMAIAEAAARGEPEPAPALIPAADPPRRSPTRNLLEGCGSHGDAVVLLDDQSDDQPPAVPTKAPPLGRLLTACRIRRSLVDEAKQRGWTDDALSRLLVVALFKAHHKEVRTPTGWAADIIREGSPEDWNKDQIKTLDIDTAAVRTWARGPDGPLA